LIENTAALRAKLLPGDIEMAAENIDLTVDQVLALRRQLPEPLHLLCRPSPGYEHINLNLANPILAVSGSVVPCCSRSIETPLIQSCLRVCSPSPRMGQSPG
jgi:hypothetical protein